MMQLDWVTTTKIAENGSLVELNLSWNHLRRKGALAIAKGIWVSLDLIRID